MKQCGECGEIKVYSGFHKHTSSKDGFRFNCKECVKEYNSKYRITNESEIKENRAEFYKNNKNSLDKAHKIYLNTKTGRLNKRKSYAKYKNKYPNKIKAKNLVARLVNSGHLIKLNHCELCGATLCRIEGHHWSYLEKYWRDVVWCCVTCHNDIHNNKEAHILRRQNDIILHHIIIGELA